MAYEIWTKEAYERGKDAAEAAGSWAADGNTDTEAIRATLRGLNEGDPVAYDSLPNPPDLSGEWAGDPTSVSLAREITGDDDPPGEVIEVIAEAFNDGIMEHFEDACVTTLRALLPDDERGGLR